MGFSIKGALSGAAGGFATGGGLGAIAGGALGGFAQGAMDKEDYSNAKKMWNYQFEKQKEWEKYKMENAYQMRAKDLSAAGINPAIAGGEAAMNASAPNPGLSDAIASGKSAANHANTALQAQRLQMDNQKVQAEINNINNDTLGKSINNAINSKYGDKAKKEEIANTIQNTALLRANSAKTTEEINNLIQEQWLTKAQTAKTQNESVIEANKIPKSAKEAQFYRADPLKMATIATYGRELAPAINSAAGIAAAIGSWKKLGNLEDMLNKATETTYYNKNGEITGGKSVRRRK